MILLLAGGWWFLFGYLAGVAPFVALAIKFAVQWSKPNIRRQEEWQTKRRRFKGKDRINPEPEKPTKPGIENW